MDLPVCLMIFSSIHIEGSSPYPDAEKGPIPMENIVQISPADILIERPFTHPSHIPEDLSTLRYMAGHLDLTLQNHHTVTGKPQTITINLPDQHNWVHRQVLANPRHLNQPNLVHVVGFFSHRRPRADLEQVQEFDMMLMEEIPQHDGLISYSSMQLKNGDFANLVLFVDEAAQMDWSRSEVHARAAYELSPNFFHWVRIYKGVLPHGIEQNEELRLHKARYFDYDQTPVWRGVRTLA